MVAQYLEYDYSTTTLRAGDILSYDKKTWEIRITRNDKPVMFIHGERGRTMFAARFYLDDKTAFASFCHFTAWSAGLNVQGQVEEADGTYRLRLLP